MVHYGDISSQKYIKNIRVAEWPVLSEGTAPHLYHKGSLVFESWLWSEWFLIRTIIRSSFSPPSLKGISKGDKLQMQTGFEICLSGFSLDVEGGSRMCAENYVLTRAANDRRAGGRRETSTSKGPLKEKALRSLMVGFVSWDVRCHHFQPPVHRFDLRW